ncbi:hypothetical protein TRFO_24314 [Tritrichomonas foetus]|uniref:Uncharacterized protein n=1 Tax=Tritrichomonas foetus TaxID=1144522 RepID=A0A1J4K8E7_9EUKA|nr:hypothetical protein TRFO_24314 [Tritrichomonas foetus]|eukprot:OHT07483.1 hypothetical protein TRFO_24314 [Tritrichomonas foetus]
MMTSDFAQRLFFIFLIFLLVLFFIRLTEFRNIFQNYPAEALWDASIFIFRTPSKIAPKMNSFALFRESDIILVSAFFPVNISKTHSHAGYKKYAHNLLPRIIAPMIVYTSEWGKKFIDFHGNNYIHWNTSIEKVLDIEWVAQVDAVLKEQEKVDPEICRHSYEKYLVWHSKFYLLHEVSNMYPNSYVFWLDIGSIRWTPLYPESYRFPDRQKVLKAVPKNDMIFFALNRANRKFPYIPEYIYPINAVIGGVYGGSNFAIRNFFSYVTYIRESLKDQFFGKEQNLQTTYAFNFPKTKLVLMLASPGVHYSCEWFGYMSYFGTHDSCKAENFTLKDSREYLYYTAESDFEKSKEEMRKIADHC